MKNKKIITLAILITLLLGATVTIANESVQYSKHNEEKQNFYLSSQNENRFMQRFLNRFRDMLGICKGGCNLTEIQGTLNYQDENFYIGDIELHFGPDWYIENVKSAYDYDRDGENETILEELQGLVGTTISVEGHLQSENWMSVFTIDGIPYRETGQPIWASQHQWQWRWQKQNNKP